MAIDLSNNEALCLIMASRIKLSCLDLTNVLWFSDDDVKEFIKNYNGIVSTDLVEPMLRYQKKHPIFLKNLFWHKNTLNIRASLDKLVGSDGDRTHYLLTVSQALSQMSYP